MSYPSKIRYESIDGLGPWLWPEADDGAWDGPVRDWIESHSFIVKTLAERRGVIQAGGNCGLYPALLSRLFQHVYTFEPDEANFHFLTENTKELSNVSAFQAAVGDDRRQVGMHRPLADNVGAHSVNDADEEGEVVMIPIDSFLHEGMVPIDLLWLDIEGYEVAALYGAMETVQKYLPMVGIERATESILQLLRPLGYVVLDNSFMDTFYVHYTKHPDYVPANDESIQITTEGKDDYV